MSSKDFQSIIEHERVLTSPEELVTYSYDATENRCIPKAVFRPINEEEVRKIINFSRDNEIPLTPRGAGTSLSGCAVPSEGSFVIDFGLMRGIKEIDTENSFVTVEPGVVYESLNSNLVESNLFFPPDPGSGNVCTIGGMVSTNASGIRAVKYGTTRDYVQRLRVVLASGEAVTLGNLAPKSSAGYDLVGFFVGSEGTLGIITEITLKIIKRPIYFAVASLSFDSMVKAAKAVGEIISSGLDPSVLEIIDDKTLRVIKMYQDIEVGGNGVLLVEMDGFSKEDVWNRLDTALEICDLSGASGSNVARTSEEREALWRARKAALPSLARYKPTLILEDVTVPLSRLSEMLGEITKISDKHGIEIATFGHAGDGNLHPTLLVDRKSPVEMEQTKKVMEEIFRAALSLGGTLSGEHGIGLSKREFMKLEHKNSLDLMKKLKNVFDPKNLMNPGKVL
jgi:glycolate oxidase